MKEELRIRGVAVLDALHGKSDRRDVSEARAWERDVVTAYPELEVLGPFSEAERWFANDEVLMRTGNSLFERGATYHLAEGEIETLITTVVVRLYRLQHGKPRAKSGRKAIDDTALIAVIQKRMAAQKPQNKRKAIEETLDATDPPLSPDDYDKCFERLKKKI